MQGQVAGPVNFITVTDVKAKEHIVTVFYSSSLERQLEEGKLREKYQDERFVIMTHPSPEQVMSSETTEVFYQARMQSLIAASLNRPRSM